MMKLIIIDMVASFCVQWQIVLDKIQYIVIIS